MRNHRTFSHQPRNETAAAKRTAAQAYAEHRAAIEAHLSTIDLALEQHQKRQAADERNWGFAGDLASVERLLAEAARMLGQQA